MLGYEDAAAAIDWLVQAFGFRERLRYTEDDGSVTHAELEIDGGGLIMLATPTPDYVSPKRLRETCEQARRSFDNPHVVDGVLVDVDDVDAHFARAKEAGATILSEPEDIEAGVRHYTVEDLEGHRWMFSQEIAQVAPEEWGAVEA
jgi:PhnB protein